VETSTRSDGDTREVEWQFDALDLRPVVRWLEQLDARRDGERVTASSAGTVSHLDLYLDTTDWRFHRAGYALRIRRPTTRRVADVEATLKELDRTAAPEPGLRRRRELSESLEQSDPAGLSRAIGPVGERVRAVAGRHRLRPLFEVQTRRHTLALERDGSPAGEIALDETSIRPASGGPPARLRRIEIELPESLLPAISPFVEALRVACGLQPAVLSKYEAGVLAAGLTPLPTRAFGVKSVDRDASIREVALAVLCRHFSVLLASEPGTLLGDDIEELHDMRVASRRLRAALVLFADVLPPSAVELRQELGWLGKTLGLVRDLDVQLAQLDQWRTEVSEQDWEALAALRGLLEEKRSAARAVMVEALDSRRYRTFVAGFGRLLRMRTVGRLGSAAAPARSVAPNLIKSQFRAFRETGDRVGSSSQPADYHRLRIRCKRLRYALEFTSDLYPGRTRPLIKRTVALQEILGLHQDADVAISRLRRLATDSSNQLPPETVFAMGEITERYRQAMTKQRQRFPAAYAKLTGKPWKTFRRMIEDRRPL
jgi:triphosphatase